MLELIIVAGIFSGITLVITQVFFTTIRTNKKSEIYRDVNQSGTQALDTMTRLLQNATSLDDATVCPTASAPVSPLDTLTMTLVDGKKTTLSCDTSSGYPRIASSSGTKKIFLTNENVALYDTTTSTRACTNHALVFECVLTGTNTPPSVRIRYTVVQKNVSTSSYDSTQSSFQTTVTLRNGTDY